MASVTTFKGDGINTIPLHFLDSELVNTGNVCGIRWKASKVILDMCALICKCECMCVSWPEDYHSKIVGHKSAALKPKFVIAWHLWCASYLYSSSQARHACVPQRPQRLQRTLMTLFPVYCRFLGWWQNVLGSSSCVQEWPLEEWRHCCVRFTAIGGHKRGFVPHLRRFILQGHKEWAPSWRTSYQYILPSPVKRWTCPYGQLFFLLLKTKCICFYLFPNSIPTKLLIHQKS